MRYSSRARLAFATLVVVAVVAGAASRGLAQDSATDPAAMTALKEMGAYLRGLQAFQVDAARTDEAVLDDGQKILTESRALVLADLPSRLMANVSSDLFDQQYLFDGKTFTLFARRANLYATVPAPPTVGELADKLEENYGMEVPLVDLFRWGAPGWKPDAITGAMDVGPSVVLGTTCEHYAFRQADIDWQIWIQMGVNKLPRRLVITTKTDEARPQHTVTYTWNLAPSFDDDSFVFHPPAGAGKVVLGSAAADAAK
jgi:hypothetical protein